MSQSSFNFSSHSSESLNNVSQSEKALTVSELNESIKTRLEGEYRLIWVRGEISNFKPHSSGHFYFSLKDKNSQISSVMFRGFNSKLKFRPKDGDEVIVRGRISVYLPRGSYQILCETMEPVGAGGLQQEFEKLKLKLKNEGLFDLSKKKRLPFLPFKIALVTSPTGAAVRDMIQVLSRKHPSAEIIVVPSLTQGEKAAESLLKGLQAAEKIEDVEVVITGRGGGSLEDMWCFNDEKLARYISNMKLPVISAVGHEIDFTICDFVADLRAPTPSAAAEIVCKNVEEVREKLKQSQKRLERNLESRLQQKKQLIYQLTKRLVDPRKKVADLRLRIDELVMRSENALDKNIENKKKSLEFLFKRLTQVQKQFPPLYKSLTYLSRSLMKAQQKVFVKSEAKMNSLHKQLDALNPYNVLSRGYSIVRDKKSSRIISKAEKGYSAIEIQLHEGALEAQVTQVKQKIDEKIDEKIKEN